MKRLGKPPFICLITPGTITASNFDSEKTKLLASVRDACEDGVNMVQLREKKLPGRMLFELACATVAITSGFDAPLLVNDRVDIAAAAKADGVHLPENSIPLVTIREQFGSELIVGVSTHSLANAAEAIAGGADYVIWGPVFDTPGKGPSKGVTMLSEVADAISGAPVIAVGGIDASNVTEALRAGAAGVAAIRALNDASSRRLLIDRVREWSLR